MMLGAGVAVFALFSGGAAVAGPLAEGAEGAEGAVPAACRSIPAPAAQLLHADTVRDERGVDGSGVTVGIISDSFDTIGSPSAADDVRAGVLPGADNPCGYTTPVQVVAEAATPAGDEGRAMAQLVHGIAPGATLLFSTLTETNDGLAAAIERLRAAGADIIVDDVVLDDERVFQRGAAGDAIQSATDAGVVYLSAAGNFGMIGAEGYPSAGRPISGWYTDQYRPTACPAAISAVAAREVDCMDFDPGPAADPTLGMTLPERAFIRAGLDWAEPQGSVDTTFGYGLSSEEETVVVWPTDPAVPHVRAGLDSLDLDHVSVSEISIVRERNSTASTPPVALVLRAPGLNNAALDGEYFRSSEHDTVGSSLLGHRGDPANFAVGAVDAKTLALERSTTAGPAPTLLGIPAPETISGPAVAGLDDLPISFALDGDTSQTFSGTSAAAPTVAAVAALMLQASPGASPQTIRAALAATARTDTFSTVLAADVPLERLAGSGLVDAAAAVAAVAAPTPTTTPAPAPAPAPGPVPRATAIPATPSRSADREHLARTGLLSDGRGGVLLGVGALAVALGLLARRRLLLPA